MFAHRIGSALAQRTRRGTVCNVDAAHARLRGEGHKRRAERGQLALSQAVLILGQHHHAATFRRLIRERRQLRGIGQLRSGHAGCRQKLTGLAIAQRDGAGLVEQQHIHIARCLHRAARGGNHVSLHHPAHARDANRGKQATDRGGDQAHEQRDQHGQTHHRSRTRLIDSEGRKRPQRHDHQHEHQRESNEQDRQRQLVRRLLSAGRLHHRNHAIEKRLAGVDRDLHHQPIGQHARATRDGGKVAARLADHRSRLARDGTLVHRGDALDHRAVERNGVAGLDQHHHTRAQLVGLHGHPLGTEARLGQYLGDGIALHAAQARGLGAAAAFGQCFGKVGEQHGEPQPECDRENESGRSLAFATQGLRPQQRGQDRAEVHHQHDRIAPLCARRQLAHGVNQGPTHQTRVEQRKRRCFFGHVIHSFF